jgi:hypothetical protein
VVFVRVGGLEELPEGGGVSGAIRMRGSPTPRELRSEADVGSGQAEELTLVDSDSRTGPWK